MFVKDEIPIVPVIRDDSAPKPKSAMTEMAQVLEDAVRQTNRAFKAARKPGMPLSVLSNVAREAPLGSLLVAFLLGVAIGRRRAR